ncbi:MAG: hypothetical protein J7647_27230 [Cyanobacteria bacterium SBLK]|nr:hypothetical protein [Cyanobacteria bacterium SBLK]
MTYCLKFSLLGDFARGFNCLLELSNGLPIAQYNENLPACDRLKKLYKKWQELNNKCVALYPYRGMSGGGMLENESEKNLEEENKIFKELENVFENWIDGTKEKFKKIPFQQPLRIIIISNCDTVLQIPCWENWDFKKERKAELSFYCSTFIAEQPQLKKSPKLRVLAIVGGEVIDERGDLNCLKKLPNTEIEILKNPQLNEFYEHLLRDWDKNYDIVYFGIHSDKNSVQFANKIEIKHLQKALARASKTRLKLLLFFSCNGPIQEILRIETPVPPTLIWEGLLNNKIAHSFVEKFFDFFVGGDDFSESLARSREFLAGFEDRFPRASLAPRAYLCPGQEPPTWEGIRAGVGTSRSWNGWRNGWSVGAVGAIATLLVLGLGYILAGEAIGREVNDWGNEARENRQIDRAIFYYRIAGLFWLNGTPQYNIALIYEDVLNKPDVAYKLYEISARRGDPDAVANMSGLLVLYPQLGSSESALKWLKFCITTSENLEEKFDGAKGSCWIFQGLKNLKNNNLGDAKEELLTGIRVIEENMKQGDAAPPILGYCGLFEIAVREKDAKAMIQWKNKILSNKKYASPIHNSCILEVKSEEI